MFRTEDAVKLILKGIPDRFRNEMWTTTSGSSLDKLANPGYYANTAAKANRLKKSLANEEIERDLHRR